MTMVHGDIVVDDRVDVDDEVDDIDDGVISGVANDVDDTNGGVDVDIVTERTTL